MKQRRSSSNTAHFIAKLLAVRPVSVAELPGFIAQIDRTVRRLEAEEPMEFASLRPAPVPAAATGPNVQHSFKPRAVAVSSITAPRSNSPASFKSAAKVALSPDAGAVLPRIEIIPARRRGRPPGTGHRQLAAAAATARSAIDHEIEASAPLPAQPKLMRRAEAAQFDHAMDDTPANLQAAPSDAPIRGVVKWFDGRAGKGAIRLAGIGDVALDDKVLERSNIKRLYRDQEVEAQVQHNGNKVRLVSLAIPGRNEAAALPNFGMSGETLRVVKRQPRPVVVEIKQDTGRRRRARSEADQALGSAETEAVSMLASPARS